MDENKDILVSVIVPVYNTKNYLEACLESIVSQSYKRLEIILIDDGSTDGSSDILDLYAKKDNRIKVIHNTNHGVSYSRNYGIKMANGSKIVFVDSDDTVDLDYVKKLVKPLKNGDCNLVICGINDVNATKKRVKARKFPKKLTGNLKEDFCDLFMMPIITGPVAKLYDTDLIRKNEVYFSEDITFNEDVVFNLQYLKYVEEYKIIRESLYSYLRRNSGNISSNRREKDFNSALVVLAALKKFVLDNQIVNGDIALTHQGINYLRRFSISGYSLFKERATRIRDVLKGMYSVKENKRVINVWLLKNDLLFVLYAMYWLREKGKW